MYLCCVSFISINYEYIIVIQRLQILISNLYDIITLVDK